MKDKITLRQFNEITSIQMSNLNDIEKQINTAKVLDPSLTEEAIDNMSLSDFSKLTASDGLNTTLLADCKIVKEIGMYNLTNYTEDFKFNIGQIKLIYKAMADFPGAYVHLMMAALYTNKESFEERAEWFLDNGTMDQAFPFIKLLMDTKNLLK
jgi:hypothetical protein